MLNTVEPSSKPFNHAMVFSGGGFRFGYYLGMYAAATDSGYKPDLIFAACGGAIAAGIIASFPDDHSRKQALLSPEIYDMYQRIQINPNVRLLSTLCGAIKRYYHHEPLQKAPDLASIALFNIPDEATKPFFPYKGEYTSKSNDIPQIAIIGAEVLHPAQSHLSLAQPLFAETIFCDAKLGDFIKKAPSFHPSSQIKQDIQYNVDIPLSTAIRISIGDLYYLAPFNWQQKDYIGGMLNLAPYEYANYCANIVTLELKQPYSPYTAVPVFKQMFGFDPNSRLKELHDCQANYWCDTSDSAQVLKSHQLQKSCSWWRNQLTIIPPKNYEHYQWMMETQWQYGYQRGIECYQSEIPHQKRMRHVNELNTSERFRAYI